MTNAGKVRFSMVYTPLFNKWYIRSGTVNRKSDAVRQVNANFAKVATETAYATKLRTSNPKLADYYKRRGYKVELVPLTEIRSSIRERLNKIASGLKGKFVVGKGKPIAVPQVMRLIGKK